MNLRAVLIDDEQKGIDAVKLLLENFVKDVKVVAESTIPEDAVELIENYKPEIVFLDINMPGINGFELLEKLTWRDFNLVFTTAHEEYALKALKSNAIDYLLKPIDHEDLIHAVRRIHEKLAIEGDREKFNFTGLIESVARTHRNRITFNSRTGIESIDPVEIIYLESISNYTKIVLADREIVTSKTLKDFDQMLCSEGSDFMRVHHSFIVNLHKANRLLKVSNQVVMSNDAKIPVSKSRRECFLRWLRIT